MTANARVLDKIRRCLALSESSNPNEAAQALKQAKILMQKHQLTESDVLASEVAEFEVKANHKGKNPPEWEADLAQMIAKVFECVCMRRRYKGAAHWLFIGVSPAPEVAGYAMQVVLRKCISERRDFLTTGHAALRGGRSGKIKAADCFCQGFVLGCKPSIESLDPKKDTRIAEYMEKNYSEANILATIDRVKDLKQSEVLAASYGYALGRRVGLHRPVSGESGKQIQAQVE